MIISSFGLHVASGVAFLVQGGGATNLISRDLHSPFELKIARRHKGGCPHLIDLEAYVEPPDWVADPLADAFLPVPRAPAEKVKVIDDFDQLHEQLIIHLQRLSSPTMALARPIWGRRPQDMHAAYTISNISPLIFIGATIEDTRTILEHINYAEAYGRRVVVFARERLPLFQQVERITTELTLRDVVHEPLEAIGSGALRRVMDAGHA